MGSRFRVESAFSWAKTDLENRLYWKQLLPIMDLDWKAETVIFSKDNGECDDD